MKNLKSAFLGFLGLGILTIGLAAGAAEPPFIGDQGAVVNFYTNENVNSTVGKIGYPGSQSFVLNGVQHGTYKAPDCLVLVNDYNQLDDQSVTTFLNQLEVRDGFTLSTILAPTVKNGTHVYFLVSIGGYVTEVSVKTKNSGLTFTQLRDKFLGANVALNLRLIYSRGCVLVK